MATSTFQVTRAFMGLQSARHAVPVLDEMSLQDVSLSVGQPDVRIVDELQVLMGACQDCLSKFKCAYTQAFQLLDPAGAPASDPVMLVTSTLLFTGIDELMSDSGPDTEEEDACMHESLQKIDSMGDCLLAQANRSH